MEEVAIGKVTHYFGKAMVATIELAQGELAVGDTLHIKGHTSNFTQQVDSIQVEHQSVQKASAGEAIAIKVLQHAREHDVVYKVSA